MLLAWAEVVVLVEGGAGRLSALVCVLLIRRYFYTPFFVGMVVTSVGVTSGIANIKEICTNVPMQVRDLNFNLGINYHTPHLGYLSNIALGEDSQPGPAQPSLSSHRETAIQPY